MSEGGATTPSHPNMLRNILTGVITTVLGATAVYFLGFHNSKGESSSGSFLEIKEATKNAWTDYVNYENLEYKSTKLLLNNFKSADDLDDFKNEMTKESEKFSTDVENILKRKDIDDALSSLLKRHLDAEKESMTKANAFFTVYKNIINTTTPGQNRNDKITNEYNKFLTSGNMIVERAKTEIGDLAKSLNEKYGHFFITDSLGLFKNENTVKTNNNSGMHENNNNTAITTNTNNPSDNTTNNYNKVNTNYTNTNNNQINGSSFVGEWDTPGAVITLSSNGRMSWEMDNGQSTSGTWQFNNNQIYMTYPVQGVTTTYSFNLSNVTANSFTMVLTTYPYYRYDLTRYNDNY